MMDTNSAVLAGLILRAKAQIAVDALDERLGSSPEINITSFADLHDHVDANEYGGLCEDHVVSFLNSLVPVPGQDPDLIFNEEVINQFANPLQDAVDRWIKEDGIARILSDIAAGNVERACVRAMALGIPADTGADFMEAFL